MICFFLLFLSLIVQINSQICNSTIPYSRCSSSSGCGCFPIPGANNIGICGFLWKFCSLLVPCGSSQECSDPQHVCVYHPRCSNDPVCYPFSMMDESVCPPKSNTTNSTMATTTSVQMTTTEKTSTTSSSVCEPFKQLPSESANCTKPKWSQKGVVVAGTGIAGFSPMQLKYPMGIFIDQHDNDALYVADRDNYRIQKFVQGSNGVGVTVAGGNGDGRADNQISGVYDIFVDSARNIFIADRQAHRVQKWSANSSVGETLVDLEYNYLPDGVWFNEQTGDLYVTEATVFVGSGRLTKYSTMNTTTPKRTIIAPHLSLARGLFVDQCNSNVYVADTYANGIKKFSTDESHMDGSVIFSRFETPEDVIGDCYGNLYVAVSGGWFENIPPVERINVRNGYKREAVIGTTPENGYRLNTPQSLAFDSEWNLYIADSVGNTVQKFLFEGGDLYC